eukprot:9657872-Karenia_brevis.AAC.1
MTVQRTLDKFEVASLSPYMTDQNLALAHLGTDMIRIPSSFNFYPNMSSHEHITQTSQQIASYSKRMGVQCEMKPHDVLEKT